MSFDEIQTASVVRYPYLWVREAGHGETEGRKNIKSTIIADALSGAPAIKGVVLGEAGDWVAACDIDVFCRGQTAGAVDFTHSAGTNSVRVRGYSPTGTFYVGTPPASDDVDPYISGSGGGIFRQLP